MRLPLYCASILLAACAGHPSAPRVTPEVRSEKSAPRLEQPRAESDLAGWFVVTYDQVEVRLDVAPPGRTPWKDSFAWSSIQRVCFASEGPGSSDGIYIFTSKRPESYVIPTEARGGQDVWSEFIRRGLFDAQLAIQAAGSANGLFCWPAQ